LAASRAGDHDFACGDLNSADVERLGRPEWERDLDGRFEAQQFFDCRGDEIGLAT
jgi:hypothetical protein